jgi:hypothetical protein
VRIRQQAHRHLARDRKKVFLKTASQLGVIVLPPYSLAQPSASHIDQGQVVLGRLFFGDTLSLNAVRFLLDFCGPIVQELLGVVDALAAQYFNLRSQETSISKVDVLAIGDLTVNLRQRELALFGIDEVPNQPSLHAVGGDTELQAIAGAQLPRLVLGFCLVDICDGEFSGTGFIALAGFCYGRMRRERQNVYDDSNTCVRVVSGFVGVESLQNQHVEINNFRK